MPVFSDTQVKSQVIIPDHYRKQQNLHRRLKREAKQEDKKAVERRKRWNLKTKTPLLVTLHKDEGRVPGGVRLQLDNNDVSRWVIYKRVATPTGDMSAKPDAILENVDFDDLESRQQ